VGSRIHTFFVLIALAVSLAGCGANKGLAGSRSGLGMSAYSFWPPPPSTWLWVSKGKDPAKVESLAAAADDLATQLREAGYSQQRWFPIGVGFAHGFAVTTRLEQIDVDERSVQPGRWTSLHTEPANLRWLSVAKTVPLPRPGRYRAFLLAVTDLPIGPSTTAPVWNEHTVMAGPGIPQDLSEADLPPGLRLSSAHRLGVYVYVYERVEGENQGQFVSLNPKRRPTTALLQPFAKGEGSHVP
jgi:hypothetical protein